MVCIVRYWKIIWGWKEILRRSRKNLEKNENMHNIGIDLV